MLNRRDWLRAGAAAIALPAWLRTASAAEPRFPLGVSSGQPRPDGMVLWTRLIGDDLPPTVDVRWTVAHDESFTRIAAEGTFTAEAAWAHSVHAEPRGLEPGRAYFYRFEALGDRSRTGRTRCAPAAGSAAGLRAVVASCQRFDHGYFAAWRHAAADAPDLVVFLGDYIYEYASPPGRVRSHAGGHVATLDDYRARYAQYQRDADLQAAHAVAPWLLVWDDHEVENDYAALQGQTLQPDFAQRRAAAYQAYWEHLPYPMAARPRGADMRIHARLDWGALARIHLLDDRQYRDPQACPRPGRGGSNTVPLAQCPALDDAGRSLLGAEQERWLAGGWDTARPWNLVAQQTLMARCTRSDTASPAGPTYWTDGWDGYPAARRRLLGQVAERKLPGAVVLSGDVHAGFVADLRLDDGDMKSQVVATEFCASSISSNGPAQDRVEQWRAFNPGLHYGRGDRRGYALLTLDAKRLDAEMRVLDNALDAASPVRVDARFTVEAGRPGVQPA